MKTLRLTFFAAAVLICSTQAYAVIYQARPYEPNMARWLTRDPIGERGGPNLYGFVGNNPINFYDLLGLEPELGPLSPDGMHIDDQGSIWKDRHNNS